MIFLYFCLLVLKSLSQMAFYFSNLILQTAFAKYRKWAMQHIIKELSEQGKLIEKNTGEQ